MNILVVDDEKNIAYAIAQILEEQKWQVTMAYDGQEGLDLALSGYYDVAILDIMLPVMNGFEATKAIRRSSHEQAKTIPIIAMTANAFSEDMQHSLAAGMNAHISKPVDMKLLKKTIRNIKLGREEAQFIDQ